MVGVEVHREALPFRIDDFNGGRINFTNSRDRVVRIARYDICGETEKKDAKG
jgi:hypothetical protein